MLYTHRYYLSNSQAKALKFNVEPFVVLLQNIMLVNKVANERCLTLQALVDQTS